MDLLWDALNSIHRGRVGMEQGNRIQCFAINLTLDELLLGPGVTSQEGFCEDTSGSRVHAPATLPNQRT